MIKIKYQRKQKGYTLKKEIQSQKRILSLRKSNCFLTNNIKYNKINLPRNFAPRNADQKSKR